MGSKRTKQHDDNSFSIDEEEADLFYSLKNAFSNLVIEEKGKGDKKPEKDRINHFSPQFGVDEHKAIAQQIDPEQLAAQVANVFNAFLPPPLPDTPKQQHDKEHPNTTTTTTTTTTSPTTTTTTAPTTSPTTTTTTESNGTNSTVTTATPNATEAKGPTTPPPSPADAHVAPTNAQPTTNSHLNISDEEKFEKVENEIFLISETIQYMQNVLPPTSQRTLECLGQVTDQYVKGWGYVESKPSLRQRYCVILDKIGGWWLDEFLLFPELSLAEKEKWLNTYLRKWTRADGQRSGIENETQTSLRVAPPRRPTPPPSPPSDAKPGTVEYDEYIARAYQKQYTEEHARSIGVVHTESMDDYIFAAKIQQEEENLRLVSEIDRACETNPPQDHDNEEMGEVKASETEKGDEEEMKEDTSSSSAPKELTRDASMTGGEETVNSSSDITDNTKTYDTASTATLPTTQLPTTPTQTPSQTATQSNDTKSSDKENKSPNNNNNTSNNNTNNNISGGNVFGSVNSTLGSVNFGTVNNVNNSVYSSSGRDGEFGGDNSKKFAEKYNNFVGSNFGGKNTFIRKAPPKMKRDNSDFDSDDEISRRDLDLPARNEEEEEEQQVRTSNMVLAHGMRYANEWRQKTEEDKGYKSLKRDRSEDDIDYDDDDEEDSIDYEAERAALWQARTKKQTDKHDLLTYTWQIIKNMQIVGSMRFELCRKCGMYDECIKIAQWLNDREKIMDSRLMARSKSGNGVHQDDDDLEKAMKCMLHL